MADRPNILIIFTDDQGYGDLACYGNTKQQDTSRLDQLAKEGTQVHLLLLTDGVWTFPFGVVCPVATLAAARVGACPRVRLLLAN